MINNISSDTSKTKTWKPRSLAVLSCGLWFMLFIGFTFILITFEVIFGFDLSSIINHDVVFYILSFLLSFGLIYFISSKNIILFGKEVNISWVKKRNIGSLLFSGVIFSAIFFCGLSIFSGTPANKTSDDISPNLTEVAENSESTAPLETPKPTLSISSTPSLATTTGPTNTITLTPTLTITPEPTATNTPISPESILWDALTEVLSNGNRDIDRITSIEVYELTGRINIRWAINDSFSSLINYGARKDATEILKVVIDSGIQFEEIFLVGTFSFIDIYGNVTENPAVKLSFLKTDADKINWDNLYLIYDNIYLIASYADIHSEFLED